MKLVIVTGMSGSGKSEALDTLEDMGFYCVDNLPTALLPKIAEMGMGSQGNLDKIALGIDARGYRVFDDFNNGLDQLKAMECEYTILFLDTNDETLVKRFKMTRRAHPMGRGKSLLDGIRDEREKLMPIRNKSDYIINTSNFSVKDLKEELKDMFLEDKENARMSVSISSFGFKHGLPLDADLVFDVRFMPNPHYVEELRPLTGDEKIIRDYVMNSKESHEFFDKLKDMITFLIPQYEKEGKNQLSIAIGCTGGRHRSVTIANLLYDYLKEQGFVVFKKHRDYMLQ